MIEICISILCAIIIFLTWSIEALKRKNSKLENELFITQTQLENLRSDLEDLKWQK